MKILFINSVVGFGSTGKIVETLYKEATREGHICKVAYGRDNTSDIEDENLIKIGNNIGFKLHVLKSRLTDKSGFYSNIATKNFINDVIRFDPDIIHLHNLHGYYLNIEILFNYIKKYNKKIIWTLHDCWAFTGHCAHFEAANCMKWQTKCYNCPEKRSYPKSILFDNSSKNFIKKKNIFSNVKDFTIVTPSNWLKEVVEKSFLREYKTIVINNSINLDIFKPRESDLKKRYNIENKKVILAVASVWTDRKGFSDVIELSKFLDDSYKIVMIGLNDNQIKSLPKNILGIKRTHDQVELAEWYSISEVFINPTYEDTYPTTNLEAIACGTPVITYDTGGSSEIAKNFGVVTYDKSPLEMFKSLSKITRVYSDIDVENLVTNHEYFINNYLKLYY